MQEVSEAASNPNARLSAGPEGQSGSAQIVAQQEAIAQIGQSALSHESLDALFVEASVLVGRVLGTELVSVLELVSDGSGLKVVTGLGWRPGIVGELVVPTGTGSQAGYTLATGGPLLVADLSTEDRFKVSPVITEHGMSSSMSVRIGEQEKPYGALAAFSDRPARFTPDDANFLQAVANVLAAAVVRFRAQADMRASRDQLAAILSTIDEGITVVDRQGLSFANDAAARLTGYASAEELLNASGSVLGRYDLFDEEERPMAIEALPGRRAMAGEENPQAVVGFRIHATGDMRWSMVRATAVREAGGEITHVINTFREITDERWTRDSRSFMAEAVAVLSNTLDADEAARRLASLAVPRLADYCTVHMKTEDGSIANVALAHSDPDRLDLALRVRAMRPPMFVDSQSGPARVIRDGTSEMIEIVPQLLEAANIPADELNLIRQLDMHWYISVPLLGRQGPIGALSLVTAESGRKLGRRDLALAEELGARAGIALENARLYQTADDRRAQLDAVLGALAEAVLVFDGEGNLQLANNAAERMFLDAVPATDAELMTRLGLHELNARLPDSTEEDAPEVKLNDGGLWVEVRRYGAASAIDDTRGTHAPSVVVLRDVTQARSARAARDAFLGVLSHELRTPITTIYGGSELLQRGLEPERREEVITDIRVEAERLARLVEDLLVMTRIERGTVEIGDEPILIQRLLPSIVHAFVAQRPDVEVALNLSERLSAVRGDPTYVEQVVRNLLTNAVRYGNGAARGIEITVEEVPGEIIVRVLDHGSGLGDSDPEQLFELFYRSEAARAVPGGAGIGLFVCRNLVEAMGGRIWARSREEGGAEFGFTLPVVDSDLDSA
ncbi:MAG: ATP-binding protein [Candidatus Limnocylindrales bacterium]